MDADLDTLATALYVKIDQLLLDAPERLPWRPRVGITPRISDAEVITLCVMQALLSFTSEARWLRHAHADLRHLFPYLPQQPGYNKRLRKLAGTLNWLIRQLAADTSMWSDDVWSDDVWIVDSTPIECARSRGVARGSDLADRAELISVRVLRQPLPLLLGTAAAPDRHPCTACPSRSHSPAPRPTNARPCSTCSGPNRTWWPPGRDRRRSATSTTTAAT